MKKSLFLLPLLAGLALCGCGDDKDKKGGSSSDGGETETVEPTGEKFATITMKGCADMGDPGVFEKDGAKIELEQGECAQTVQQAVTATGKNEFRVYAKMIMNFSADEDIKEILIKFSNYKSQDGKTYYFDYEDLDGATNQYSTSSCEALITLDDPASEWSCECWHQTRIVSVSFYK